MCVFQHITKIQRTQIKRDVELFVEFSFASTSEKKTIPSKLDENTLKHGCNAPRMVTTHFDDGTGIMCVNLHIEKKMYI